MFPRRRVPEPALPLEASTKTSTKPLSSAFCVEICCGTAGLAASVIQSGMDALGVDHRGNKARPKAPVMLADLTTEEGQKLVMELLEATVDSLVWVHIAPPCGTASRARERPVPKFLQKQGAPSPVPLRSDQYPEGLPGLKGVNLERVKAANAIYSFCAIMVRWCQMHDIGYSVENPRNSHFWNFPDLRNVWNLEEQFWDAEFPQCAHGGDRPANRRWRSNDKRISELSAVCNGGHPHLPFSVQRVGKSWQFDTATEAAYPLLLCQRVSKIISARAVAYGFVALPTVSFETCPDNEPVGKRARMKASLGGFARGDKLPQIIPEFKEVIVVAADKLPASCKVGDRVKVDSCCGKVVRCDSGDASGHHFAVGIYFSPEEFAQRAYSLQHPIDMDSVVCKMTKENAFWILTTPAVEVAQYRMAQVAKLRDWIAKSGDKEDAERRRRVPEAQAVISARKRVAALRWLCEQTDYPDVEATELLFDGAAVLGHVEPSGIFPKKVSPPSITVQQLEGSCKWTGPAIAARVKPSGDDELDRAVWSETIVEVEKGWLRGPYASPEEVRRVLGKDFIPSRRFGIRQGPKIRVIDDFSESMVNSTIGVSEKLDLHTLDESVAAIKMALDSVGPAGDVYIVVDRQSILKGKLPKGRTTEQAKQWLGKCVDLKAAYRQVPIRAQDQWAAVVVAWSPIDNAPRYFLLSALPFGSTGSVYGFNRLSRCLWAVLGKWLKLVWTNYYDDYPTYELSETATIADLAIRSVMALLGWDLSLDKAKPFDPVFAQLGAIVNLSECASNRLVICNKPERTQSISEQLNQCLKSGVCLSMLAAEIAGKCQFASSHIAGRVALGFIHVLTVHQHRVRGGKMDSDTVVAMEQLLYCLNHLGPRVLDSTGQCKPILVFPDGAAEGEDRGIVSVGAVIVDTASHECMMFGGHVPDELIGAWKADGRVQVIGQAELLPVVLSRLVRPGWFRDRRVFFFIDNDSARHALIKGYSPAKGSLEIVREFVRMELAEHTWSWFARIPSPSNPGDGPSRLDLVPSAANLFATPIPMPVVPKVLYPAKS